MATASLLQRAARAVEASATAERLARAQELLYGPVIRWARRGPLHTDALGHSLHPPLTDVTAGCWLATSVLDLAGGTESRRGAVLLAGAGVLASIPTAFAGAAELPDLTGGDRRTAAVHALGADVAILLFTGSLVARLRGRHGVGVGLAAGGNLVVSAAGFLGGHLALHRGVARRPVPGEDDGDGSTSRVAPLRAL